MKKWHMEGIISLPDNQRRQLIVPDRKVLNLWSGDALRRTSKQSRLVAALRGWAGLLLRYF